MNSVFRVRESLIRPENESGKFEGDMILTEEQMEFLKSHEGRTGLVNTRYRWPGAVVPYHIEEGHFSKC
jgi:hypothetical protein